MFVPCIPTVPRTTVINKTIVYCDTVLSLNDVGSNIKIASISGISENELEKCLKIILEANPDVVFNTIQYSRSDKKVYFYTNKVINTKAYEESKYTKYKPITTKSEILEEIKNILVAPENIDNECVSLYDVCLLDRKINYDYDEIEKKYSPVIKSKLSSKFGSSSSVCIHKFDHDKNLLHISFKRWNGNDYDDIYLTKTDGDLHVVKSECCWTDEVFEAISSPLSKMYDEYILYNEFKDWDKSKNGIKPVNCNFFANINCYGVSVYVPSPSNRYQTEFKLAALSYDSKFTTECNSNTVMEAIKGNEMEIFKRIFVKISDCPIWMQGILYAERKKQVEELEKTEKIRKQKEEKKQKRLEYIRKVFPFIKK